ncbi:hypothetical protein PFICI_09173 [Pestalotiopsis fici W106-1]|uniref:DUF7918 domain-containing protein n=1 Tax=Pestalotiopsis fici (strain W106-1 / CGMCC3.15140) TaxID=1229662 RepID=W3WZQ0_PESFW|nr:uncharacterized protein PFICI_09173 [Pestalotiopsis fici W106-1]ETS79320.1 hypothetical protein PFICI_09173 [Pestalotiopsis fici W106-1]
MIHEDVPGMEVTVQINGVDVKEYDAPEAGDEDKDYPTITKYIESIDDAFFAVNLNINNHYDWRHGKAKHCLSCECYVDGCWIGARVVKEARDILIRGHQSINNAGEGELSKLQFASIQTIDDAKKERVEKDMKATKNLGLIDVKLYRGTEHGAIAHQAERSPKRDRFEFAEKSLKGKAISHGTTLRSKEQITKPYWVDFRHLPEDNKQPIARFRFLYRSRDALKREMIIPRSPTPSPPTFNALSDAELRRLARERFNQLQDSAVKNESSRPIKRELGEVYDLTGSTAPKKQRKGKMTRLESGRRVEVIDLSDDDE